MHEVGSSSAAAPESAAPPPGDRRRKGLMVAWAAVLAAGFYAVYGRGRGVRAGDESCASGDACAVPRSRRRDRMILWGATVLALVFWSFTYWSTLLT